MSANASILKKRIPSLSLLLRHATLRRGVCLHATPVDRFEVHIAQTAQEHAAARRLVRAAYVAQGIESVRKHEMPVERRHLRHDAKVLVAYRGRRMVGTMTVFLDSEARLPLDCDYPDALRAMREDGARLAEFGALAVVESFHGDGVTNLINLAAFRLAYSDFDATHIVIGVHPRAVPLYEAVYTFARLGSNRSHARLNAMVAGLVQERGALERHFTSKFNRRMPSGCTPLGHIRGESLACVDFMRKRPRAA